MRTNYSGHINGKKSWRRFLSKKLGLCFFLKVVKKKTSITNESLVFQAFCLLLWNDVEERN